MTERIDMTGQRYGRLQVIAYAGQSRPSKGPASSMWLCACDCGARHTARRANIIAGRTKSCGCLRRERTAEKNRRQSKKGSRHA